MDTLKILWAVFFTFVWLPAVLYALVVLYGQWKADWQTYLQDKYLRTPTDVPCEAPDSYITQVTMNAEKIARSKNPFGHCNSLYYLDVSGFDVAKFEGAACTRLHELLPAASCPNRKKEFNPRH